MNNDCNGDFFQIGDKKYYCCFADSAVIERGSLNNGRDCPECGRIIQAEDAGFCDIEKRAYVIIPKRGTIEMECIRT